MNLFRVALGVSHALVVGCTATHVTDTRLDATVSIDLATDVGHSSDDDAAILDSGATDGALANCTFAPPWTPTEVACSSATRRCFAACTTLACQQACVENDDFSGPADVTCLQCLVQAELACSYTLGCDDEYDAYRCCLAESCAGMSPTSSCATTQCGAAGDVYTACTNAAFTTRPACRENAVRCFPSS